MQLLGFADSHAQTVALAEALDAPWDEIEIHHFPDGESKLRLPASLPERVVLCRSLDDPNAKLIELLLAARGARELGARHLSLVCPYLGYMRQDAAFAPGEVVSQRAIGQFLADLFEEVITVDPHLHRVAHLSDAVPARRAVALGVATTAGAFLSSKPGRPLLLGPDSESRKWVQAVADVAKLPFAVAAKRRLGDRSVEVQLPDRDYAGLDVMLVDDMASTGRTLARAASALTAAGARRIEALVTHALFVDDALTHLSAAGVARVYSSDSIPHPTNAFPLA
ncbi:MAG: ribose-phosphate diphosphokinase, partial [Myxococcales bacterium]|nr:ribose-phosphate diphosphokinase [Myxococcales bacterium]